MADFLEQFPNLPKLDFEEDEIDADEAERLARALVRHQKLAELDLCRGPRQSGIGDRGAVALAEALEENAVLRVLNLRNNGIYEDGCERLAQALERNKSLTELNLCRNYIGTRGAHAFASALLVNSCLKELDISSCGLRATSAPIPVKKEEPKEEEYSGPWFRSWVEAKARQTPAGNEDSDDEETKARKAEEAAEKAARDAAEKDAIVKMTTAIGRHCALTSVNLRENRIGDEAIAELCEGLKVNNSITDLNLWRCSLSPDGAEHLAQVICENETLSNLNLLGNDLGNSGIASLAAAIAQNVTLTHLDISGCGMGDSGPGVERMSDCLKSCKLRELHLSRNGIADEGIECLSAALTENRCLSLLTMSENSITDRGCVALSEALKKNAALCELELCKNKIGDAGARLLGMALTMNCTLKVLNLQDNLFGTVGAEGLAVGLEHNSCLVDLDVSRNTIDDKGAERFGLALSRNATMKVITLQGISADASTVEWIEELAASKRVVEHAEPLLIADISKVDRAFDILEGSDGSESSSHISEDDSSSYSSGSDDDRPSRRIPEEFTLRAESLQLENGYRTESLQLENVPASRESAPQAEDAVVSSLDAYREKLTAKLQNSSGPSPRLPPALNDRAPSPGLPSAQVAKPSQAITSEEAKDRLRLFERRVQDLRTDDLQRARGGSGTSRSRLGAYPGTPPGVTKAKSTKRSGPVVD